jgi:GH24 family phage-related lysozyme (muramidase)
MLNWNISPDHTSYSEERFDLLKLLEGSTTKPYVDAVGDATIGLGFNLVYNLEPVLRVIVGGKNWNDTYFDLLQAVVDATYSPGDSGDLIDDLNAVMSVWHKIDSDVPATFSFKNDAQIVKALNALDNYYDGRIDSWLADIPESSERAALFSLAWNAPGMLGPKLHAAIENGDRAEAGTKSATIRYRAACPTRLRQPSPTGVTSKQTCSICSTTGCIRLSPRRSMPAACSPTITTRC